MIEFCMPSLGADMEVGTVLEWFVKPGDSVRRGDIVALVDTDKAEIEVEIWDTGVVDQLLVPVGQQVAVGIPLATLAAEGAAGASSLVDRTPVAPKPASAPIAAPRPSLRAGERLRATPLARRVATRLGVDLSEVAGTGSDGAITRADVERAAGRREAPAVPVPQPIADAERRSLAMRKAIAKAMARSKREIPHYYLDTTIDLQRAHQWLGEENRRREVTRRLLPFALLLKATARALDKVPELNGHWIEGAFRPVEAKHIGIAISLRAGGLLAPAIRDVDRKDLDTLMEALRDLVSRTRSGKLRSSEVSDPTITATNLGDTGVERVYGVIYPPQVALVGFGRIVERPWAEVGMIGVRPTVTVTLAADHRASDGIRGAKFLTALTRLLTHPEAL